MNGVTKPVRALVLLSGWGAALVLLLGWAASPVLADFSGDSAIYWLTANHYSPWGTSHPQAAHFAARSVYPPLFPWVLALSGGGTSLLAAHHAVAVIAWGGLLALVCVFRQMGLAPRTALFLVSVFAISRASLLETLDILSEPLYLLCSTLAIAFALLAATRPRAIYAAALAVTAAYLTRTSGLTLAVAMLCYIALRHRPALPACLVLIGGPILAWSVLHHGSGQYVGDFLAHYRAHGLVTTLARDLQFLWLAWEALFAEPGLPAMTPWLPALLAGLAMIGLWQRVRARAPDALYIVAYLALLVAWPYPAEYQRMLYPVLPLLLAQSAWCVLHGQRRVPARIGAALGVALLLATVAPFAVHAALRAFETPQDPAYQAYTRTRAWFMVDAGAARANVGYQRGITEALGELRARVPPSACVLATKPSVVSLYSERRARGFPRPDHAGRTDLARLDASPCRWLFMAQAATPTYPRPYYPYDQVRDRLSHVVTYANPVLPTQPVALLGELEARCARTRLAPALLPTLHSSHSLAIRIRRRTC